jgi:hypothetical protein
MLSDTLLSLLDISGKFSIARPTRQVALNTDLQTDKARVSVFATILS